MQGGGRREDVMQGGGKGETCWERGGTLRAFSADSCSAAMRSARGRRYPGAWRAKGCEGGAQAGCCVWCERRARHTADTHLKPVPMLICSTCARAPPL